jgi:hypothetical protein
VQSPQQSTGHDPEVPPVSEADQLMPYPSCQPLDRFRRPVCGRLTAPPVSGSAAEFPAALPIGLGGCAGRFASAIFFIEVERIRFAIFQLPFDLLPAF